MPQRLGEDEACRGQLGRGHVTLDRPDGTVRQRSRPGPIALRERDSGAVDSDTCDRHMLRSQQRDKDGLGPRISLIRGIEFAEGKVYACEPCMERGDLKMLRADQLLLDSERTREHFLDHAIFGRALCARRGGEFSEAEVHHGVRYMGGSFTVYP